MIKKKCTIQKILFLVYFIIFVPGSSIATQLNKNSFLTCKQIQMSSNGNIKDCFIGTWKLITNMKTDGEVTTYPYGKDAVGYITYDSNGYMSVQIMQQNRKSVTPGYFAYFGRYEVDPKTNVIHHYLDGSLTPAEVGTDRQRRYQFIDNQLHLTPVEEKNREIIWEKIS